MLFNTQGMMAVPCPHLLFVTPFTPSLSSQSVERSPVGTRINTVESSESLCEGNQLACPPPVSLTPSSAVPIANEVVAEAPINAGLGDPGLVLQRSSAAGVPNHDDNHLAIPSPNPSFPSSLFALSNPRKSIPFLPLAPHSQPYYLQPCNSIRHEATHEVAAAHLPQRTPEIAKSGHQRRNQAIMPFGYYPYYPYMPYAPIVTTASGISSTINGLSDLSSSIGHANDGSRRSRATQRRISRLIAALSRQVMRQNARL